MQEPRRILVRAANWVGDAVMSLPALQSLRQAHPQAHIAVLGRPWVADLYAREEFCTQAIADNTQPGWEGLRGKWALARQLRREQFDLAVLLPNSFESATVVRAARVPQRVGYNRDGRGFLLTDAVSVPKKGEIAPHQRFYYLELLRRARLIADYGQEAPVQLSGRAAAARQGREYLEGKGAGERMIGVAPGAAFGGAKRWLPERFSESVRVLAKQEEAGVVIVGSAKEKPICNEVQRGLWGMAGPVLNLAGETSMAQLIATIAACSLFLTNDSGPMHIASALGVPTIAVFGATDAAATGPAGNAAHIVQQHVPCSPCLLRECPIDHRCMTAVTAEMVIAVAQLTGERRQPAIQQDRN